MSGADRKMKALIITQDASGKIQINRKKFVNTLIIGVEILIII
jgi:hypothetical protein